MRDAPGVGGPVEYDAHAGLHAVDILGYLGAADSAR
jgi:hypothetical protein